MVSCLCQFFVVFLSLLYSSQQNLFCLIAAEAAVLLRFGVPSHVLWQQSISFPYHRRTEIPIQFYSPALRTWKRSFSHSSFQIIWCQGRRSPRDHSYHTFQKANEVMLSLLCIFYEQNLQSDSSKIPENLSLPRDARMKQLLTRKDLYYLCI